MKNPFKRILFPKPNKTFAQLLGPSVLMVALSINGGELLLWPDIVSRHQFSVLWTIPIILAFQYFVNLEIERYTTVTGKNTLSGLISLQKWISGLFIVSIIVSLAWPAWAAPAGSMMAYLLGYESLAQILSIGILIGLILIWQSKKSYQILEKISKVGLLTVLGVVVITIINQFDPSLPGELLQGFTNIGSIPSDIDRIALLSALAFGGVVGVLNLVQSDWVAQKGYGAAGLDTPEKITWNKESVNNFKEWWSLLTKEHFVIYYLGNVIGITLLAALAFLTVSGEGVSGFSILTTQVEVLSQSSILLGYSFGFAVIAIFVMAQMTILDAMGKLLKKCIPDKPITSSRISQGMGVLGIIILLISYIIPTFSQPAFLLQLSASLSAVVMVIYPPLLLKLNSTLPAGTRPQWYNSMMVYGCSVFYAAVILWVIL